MPICVAAFGTILYSLEERLNKVNLIHIPTPVEEILSKNGFLSHYGRAKIPDRWGTTITYQRFDVEDDHYFAGYIEDELIHRSEMPEMSPGLLKKFRESIFEIFSNAVLHSHTKLGIFSCGQVFPNRNQLDFTVADLGVNIRENIKACTGCELSPEKRLSGPLRKVIRPSAAICPAERLGLKILCDFVDLNGGCIRIVSDAGYWQHSGNETVTKLLSYPFPGTVVSVEINTADRQTYILASELNAEDLF